MSRREHIAPAAFLLNWTTQPTVGRIFVNFVPPYAAERRQTLAYGYTIGAKDTASQSWKGDRCSAREMEALPDRIGALGRPFQSYGPPARST